MILWTIEAAKESGIFDRILVSTDSKEIVECVYSHAEIETPFLRDSAADDHSPVSEATLRALIQLNEQLGESYDEVYQLMANCPIRGAEDILKVHGVMKGNVAALSCFQFGWMNPWWAFKISDKGEADWLFPDAITQRSQDLEDLYCPSGAIWAATVEGFKQYRNFKMPGAIQVPLSWQSCVDIDDEGDLQFAEAVATLRGLA
jgi:N-acylneuraminate cytidylyltransferase